MSTSKFIRPDNYDRHPMLRLINPKTADIETNRDRFLIELRTQKYRKGCIKSDETTGKPIFEKPGDEDGWCACAIMTHMFSPVKFSPSEATKALGLTPKECKYIQQELNDTDLTFDEIADRISKELFKR